MTSRHQVTAALAQPSHTLPETLLRNVFLVLLGAGLMALSAHVQVPFWPVKLSMQTFSVLVIATALGSRLAGLTMLTYIAQGVVGLPVFQSGAGLAYLAGPTGGYLVGFVLSAVLMGCFVERGWLDRWTTAIVAIAVSMAIVYVPGLLWLSALFGAERSIGFGLMPFLTGDFLKLVLATAALPMLLRRITRGIS